MGVVLNEPTVVALSLKDKKVLAVGSEAKNMLGKEPKHIIARRPLRNGGISNYRLAYMLLSEFMNKSLGRWRIIRPDVIVSVPSKLNSIEERALVKALESFGVHTTHLYPEAMAAAIGAGLPVNKPEGNMIMNLGGGTAEIALISLGGIVVSRSHVGTGDALNEAIMKHIEDEFHLQIGEQTAEKIKMEIGNALHSDTPKNVSISGKNPISGKTAEVILTSNDVLSPIRKVLDNIVITTSSLIEDAPSELITDLADRGIALSGGTALLKNIDVFLTKSLGIPCYIVEDPLSCVVRGLNQTIRT
jgi:rod shape-determining protein MreB